MSPQPPHGETDRSPRPDASMWLLNHVMHHSLDESYRDAAARRARQGDGGAGRSARLWLVAGLVLTAMVVTIGAVQTRESAPAVAQEREELLERVRTGTGEAEELQEEVDDLRDRVAELRHSALQEEGDEDAELTALLAGAITVTGPGLELVVDDAEGAGAEAGGGPRDGSGFADTGRLRDRDLQRVINGLWAAGAEAIAVNGQRLTSLSAIRAAGDAILVDNRPLGPPYTVEAIGDGETFRERFEQGGGGAALESLTDHYGIRSTLTVSDDLRLPAASSLHLRTAIPAGAEPADQPARPGEEDTTP